MAMAYMGLFVWMESDVTDLLQYSHYDGSSILICLACETKLEADGAYGSAF